MRSLPASLISCTAVCWSTVTLLTDYPYLLGMSSSKFTILITDDERSIRNTLREILEYEEYRVLEAENGEEALACIESSHVDLVLLDIKMKGMDGIEVLRSEEHTSELQSRGHLVCRLLLDK